MPPALPTPLALGSEDEAASAAEELRNAFEHTPGALSWLRKRTASSRRP